MNNRLLKIKNLQKTYDNKTYALKGIDIELNKGEFVVVIGPSGAGKSTFIRCINRMIDPSEGEIVFDGVHMEKVKGKSLRQQRSDIGMIFQHYNLVGRVNVIKNVLHGRLGKMSFFKSALGLYGEEDKREAFKLLQKVGLEEHIYKRADSLSGGQMQRVGICRAIVQQPKLLLADEPIASLDPKSADIVMDQLKEITTERNLTCIVNLHQVDYAKKYASRIIGIKDGMVVFNGAPSKLNNQMIAHIYKGKEEQMTLTPQEESLAYQEQEVSSYV
ncbi:phosphonate ABC transporter ATP-binding protein [Sutcliffiella horikoshii]|uniref:Phosphonate ABC transporter ATP-binding protein n=1 Tax=Sutcliffiella horikoshii TaxID=79883 RepID=A0A5D4T6A2_9BACI|nr:phosphonate ABC transporter ATP-binding protein [Sutcliffiella horikoshii]TYS71133.1 phosphonate ABC transporter ATP-binding protein [Sutcliffiella horikoshii]